MAIVVLISRLNIGFKSKMGLTESRISKTISFKRFRYERNAYI